MRTGFLLLLSVLLNLPLWAHKGKMQVSHKNVAPVVVVSSYNPDVKSISDNISAFYEQYTKTQGLLGAFFESIGQCKRGETFRPRWNEVVGSKGLCRLGIREYTKQSGPHAGETGQSNEVTRFLPPPEPTAAPAHGWTQGAF
jgi:hypothetical protein